MKPSSSSSTDRSMTVADPSTAIPMSAPAPAMERDGGAGASVAAPPLSLSSAERDERCGDRCIEVMEEDTCCVRFVCMGPNPMMARYVYALIFLATNLLALTIRDYGHSALGELRRLKGCRGARYCLGAEGVLRISLGCFLFFFVMFLSTSRTRKTHDCRNSWHSQWWPAKIALWMALTAVPFFAPSPLIQLYGKVAHFGAGAFLVIQLISVTRFITWLIDCCRSENNHKRCQVQVQVVSIVAYVGALLGIVLMYVWYAPDPSCKLNILFITVTLLLVQLMTFVSVNSKVKAGYLAPGLMGIYVVFLCWSAIRSEPHTEICNRKASVATSADWLNIVSFVIAVIVVVAATFSTGINSKCLQFMRSETESDEDDDVPYGFGFFHFVFAMGAMYFAMLFVGWNAHHRMEKWTIDVGWASAWVRIGNEWLAAIVYIWMMIAPVLGVGGEGHGGDEVVGEGVLDDGNLQKIAPLGEVGGLEVEGDGDERLDALDRRGLSPERGVVVCSGGEGEAQRRRPSERRRGGEVGRLP